MGRRICELRTPLNAILGYTELMADGAYGEPSENILGVLKRLEANGDVLDLSKIEAGQLVLELSDYCIQDIAQTVRSTLEPLAADKKLGFKVEVAPQLPPGRGDGRRLTQVLINLVGNAIKFRSTLSSNRRSSLRGGNRRHCQYRSNKTTASFATPAIALPPSHSTNKKTLPIVAMRAKYLIRTFRLPSHAPVSARPRLSQHHAPVAVPSKPVRNFGAPNPAVSLNKQQRTTGTGYQANHRCHSSKDFNKRLFISTNWCSCH
jgi:hypothetical protein